MSECVGSKRSRSPSDSGTKDSNERRMRRLDRENRDLRESVATLQRENETMRIAVNRLARELDELKGVVRRASSNPPEQRVEQTQLQQPPYVQYDGSVAESDEQQMA